MDQFQFNPFTILCGDIYIGDIKMNKEDIEAMNPILLLSLMNTKLRDEFKNLDDLCKYYNVKCELIEKKLNDANYSYNKVYNKFI